MLTDILRIVANSTVNPITGCWEYDLAKTDGGYGFANVDGQHVYAHVAVFEAVHGYRPEMVCHHCDNGACINPSHMFPGNATSNMQDMAAKGHSAAAKLTPEIVKAIRATTFVHGTATQLAGIYGVTRAAIVAAKKGITYKWLA